MLPQKRWLKELQDAVWSPSYLRTAAEFLMLLLICFIGCWLLNREITSRPSLISGKVIDSVTGQPTPYTDVRVDQMNFSQIVARTDAQGHFAFLAPQAPNLYFLFAGTSRYNRLLQTAFRQRHYLGRNRKFESLLMQHGVPVHIRARETSEPVLPLLTTKELIDIGLKSLQHATERR